MVFFNGCKRHSDCFTCPFADCIAYGGEPPAQRVPLRSETRNALQKQEYMRQWRARNRARKATEADGRGAT